MRIPVSRAGLWLGLVLCWTCSGGSPDSLPADGRALRDMLLARGNLREAREPGSMEPRLAQQSIGRWLQPGVHPANVSRAQRVPANQEQASTRQQQSPKLVTVHGKPLETGASDTCVQEYDAKVRHLGNVLQCGIPHPQLLALLQSVGGDVSAAANLCLDAQASGDIDTLLAGIESGAARDSANAAAAAPWHSSSSACALEQWRDCVFAGRRSVCKWEGNLPMKLASLHVVAYLTRSLREGFLAPGTLLTLSRPSLPSGSLKRRQISRIVRFAAEARVPHRGEGAGKSKAGTGKQERLETCEGRLPTEVTRVLAPLMDSGVISLRGSVCSPPPPAADSGKASMLFADVGIHLEILLNRPAFGRALDYDLMRQLLVLVGAEEVRVPV